MSGRASRRVGPGRRAAAAAGALVLALAGGCATGSGDVDAAGADAAVDAPAIDGPARHVLTVTRAGVGTGTVTSSPADIDCGSDCTESYDAGTVVTLTATAASGSSFSGWSGACSGTGGCTVTMSQAHDVTAAFGGCTSAMMTLYAIESVSINYSNPSGNVYNDNNTRAYNNPTGNCGGGPPCDITGWLEFDVTSIPDTATITAMTLHAYATTNAMGPTVRVQYSATNNWTRTTATVAGMPRTNPQVGDPMTLTVNTYNVFTISVASQSWAADLADNSLTLGVDNTNPAYSYGYFTGADTSASNRPYLTVTYCN